MAQYHKVCIDPFCNTTFITDNYRQKLCGSTHYHPCPICGKPAIHINNEQYDKTCSYECQGIKRSQTMKLNNSRYINHQLDRVCAFPGCDVIYTPSNPNQKLCGKQHYTNCVVCNKLVPQNFASLKYHTRTCSYVCGRVLHSKSMKSLNGSYMKKSLETRISNNGPFRVSNKMIQFANMLLDSGIPSVFDYPFGGYLYDIYIPFTNVFVEINPTVTHNSYRDPWGGFKDKYYHSDKSSVAEDSNYACIHVFDWDDERLIIQYLISCNHFEVHRYDKPSLHWYREKDKSHLVNNETFVYTDMINSGYLPVYDSARKIEYILV